MRISKRVSRALLSGCLAVLLPAVAGAADKTKKADKAETPKTSERHLANIRQLTFGRQNAEAYFSFSGNKLIGNADSPIFTLGFFAGHHEGLKHTVLADGFCKVPEPLFIEVAPGLERVRDNAVHLYPEY